MKHTMIISKNETVKIIEGSWLELVQQVYLSAKGSRVQYWSESDKDWKDFDFGGER